MYKQEYLKYKKKYIESKRLYGGNSIQKTQIKYNEDTCKEYIYYINSLPLNFMKYEDYEIYKDKKISAFLITNNNELCREDLPAINDIIEDLKNKNVPIYLEDNSYIYQDDNKKYYWSLVSLAETYFDNQEFGEFKKSYSTFKMIYEGTLLLEIVLKVLFLIVEKYYITYEKDFKRFYELIEGYNDINNKKEFCELYDKFDKYICSSFFIFYNDHPDYYLKQSLHKDAISAINSIKDHSNSYNDILQALRFNIYYFKSKAI